MALHTKQTRGHLAISAHRMGEFDSLRSHLGRRNGPIQARESVAEENNHALIKTTGEFLEDFIARCSENLVSVGAIPTTRPFIFVHILIQRGHLFEAVRLRPAEFHYSYIIFSIFAAKRGWFSFEYNP